jgi:Uma2 family endonuclease
MGDAALKLPTAEDFWDTPDDCRAELIDGQIVYRVQPSSEHSEFQTNLTASMWEIIRRGSGGGSGQPGWWIRTEINVRYSERKHGFTHDIAGWRRDKHPEKPKGKWVDVAPDWVCEILSGNRLDDLVTKRWVLHSHEVAHYWVVDTDTKTISIHRWHAEGYLLVKDACLGEKLALEPFTGIEFDVSFLFGEQE